MVKKKRQSKRTSLKDKYKMKKKVDEHHRKARREERKKAKLGIKPKAKKDPGLPNLMPYKEQFLRKMLEDKEREREHETKRIKLVREKRRLEKLRANGQMQEGDDTGMDLDDDDDGNNAKRRAGPGMEDLARAAERGAEFEETQVQKALAEEEASTTDAGAKGKKRMYLKDLRNVVNSSDVVLLVLDARDPMSCRAPQAEKMVLEAARNKRLVLVLNKIDLIPKQVAERWLTELRKEFPTVAFRSSTQQQRSNLGRASKDSIGLGASSSSSSGSAATSSLGAGVCVGADTLLQLLKNYSRNKDIKTSITVGVVGFPNVGKSSVINSLKRSRAVGVSPTAGFTKVLQQVQLDKKVKLIDSPGVLFMDSEKNDRLVLRNCLDPGELEDPVSVVMRLLEKCNINNLMMLYNLPRTDTPASFLAQLALKRGRLNKGGVPEKKAAAREVLQDWNSGKIPYFVEPPKVAKDTLPRTSATIVTEWSKEFDMEALLVKEESELVERLPADMSVDDFAVVFQNSVSV